MKNVNCYWELDMKIQIREGQVWSYKTRKSEEGSKLTVIKTDKFDDQLIVHIQIDGLKLVKKKTGEIISTSIEHLPISLEMFNKSVCKLESVVESSINDGYLHWKKLFNQGEAGVWSVEIANAIEMTEDTCNS